jgi:isopentenyldiphosphate isomerase
MLAACRSASQPVTRFTRYQSQCFRIMSYLDRIRAVNNHDPGHFRAFRIGSGTVGWFRHDFAERLRDWPAIFAVEQAAVDLSPDLQDFDRRTQALDSVIGELVGAGVIDHRHGEQYPVSAGDREQALCVIDRAAAPYFGIRAFGQHINGFVREGDELRMWIARRSPHKRTFPGRLDNMVAGGLPWAMTLEDNLIKECDEEASIPAELARRARPVSEISYRAETRRGFKPDTMYCYDLELPPDVPPRCNDDEVESFQLLPLPEVMAIVRDTEEMKPNSAVTVIDFLVRHGRISASDPDYAELVDGLRR